MRKKRFVFDPIVVLKTKTVMAKTLEFSSSCVMTCYIPRLKCDLSTWPECTVQTPGPPALQGPPARPLGRRPPPSRSVVPCLERLQSAPPFLLAAGWALSPVVASPRLCLSRDCRFGSPMGGSGRGRPETPVARRVGAAGPESQSEARGFHGSLWLGTSVGATP